MICHHPPVGTDILQQLDQAIRPDHLHRINYRISPQTKMNILQTAALKPVRRRQIVQLHRPFAENHHLRPKTQRVRRGTDQLYVKKMSRSPTIPIHQRRTIRRIDHNIQRPIIIQINTERTVGKSRLDNTPLLTPVRKNKTVRSLEDIVARLSIRTRRHHRRIDPGPGRKELYKVQIVRPVLDTIGNKNILPPVVVEVRDEG
jgi:hypothetical protein